MEIVEHIFERYKSWIGRHCSFNYHYGILADGFNLEQCVKCHTYICYECGTRNELDLPMCRRCGRETIVKRYLSHIFNTYVYTKKIPTHRFYGFWEWLAEFFTLQSIWKLSPARVVEEFLRDKSIKKVSSIPEFEEAKKGAIIWV